jgi:hypothetical protein
LNQILQSAFTWLGGKYLWHIPPSEADYAADSQQQKDITFPDLEKQDNNLSSLGNIEAASESFKHEFLKVHR